MKTSLGETSGYCSGGGHERPVLENHFGIQGLSCDGAGIVFRQPALDCVSARYETGGETARNKRAEEGKHAYFGANPEALQSTIILIREKRVPRIHGRHKH